MYIQNQQTTPTQPIIHQQFITSNTYTFTTSNDIIINMLHPHNLQYATPTNNHIFKYMLYLHFTLILVAILNLCSALKFRAYICVYTKSLPSFCV